MNNENKGKTYATTFKIAEYLQWGDQGVIAQYLNCPKSYVSMTIKAYDEDNTIKLSPTKQAIVDRALEIATINKRHAETRKNEILKLSKS